MAEPRKSAAARSKGVKKEFKAAEVIPHPVPGSTEFIPPGIPKNRIVEAKKAGVKFGGAEGEAQAAEAEANKEDNSSVIIPSKSTHKEAEG